MNSTRKSFFLGIAGGTGSGKSTIARNLLSRMPAGAAVLLDHDSYYKDRAHLPPHERELINFDHPDALDNDLLVSHLDDLVAGRAIEVPRYDFVTHTRQSETRHVEPVPIVVLEGMLILSDERLRRHLDVKIFVETDADVRFLRRARRDMESRGRTFEQVEQQYYGTVRPMHLKFVEPSRKWADVLIPEGGNNRVALDLVACKLLAVLHSAATEGSISNGCQVGPSEPPVPPPAHTMPPPAVVT